MSIPQIQMSNKMRY